MELFLTMDSTNDCSLYNYELVLSDITFNTIDILII